MSLKELLPQTKGRKQNPNEIDKDKVSQLLASNRRRAADILLSIKLTLPAQVSSVTKK
jgi:hypothetical protein